MHEIVVAIHIEVGSIQDSESSELHHHQMIPLCQRLKTDIDV